MWYVAFSGREEREKQQASIMHELTKQYSAVKYLLWAGLIERKSF